MTLALAIVAGLVHHFLLPAGRHNWVALNLENAIFINVLLAVFNMIPLPPLDGGRVAVGLLPDALARPLSRLEPYGMLILIAILIALPWLGAPLGQNLDLISQYIRAVTGFVIKLLPVLTVNV